MRLHSAFLFHTFHEPQTRYQRGEKNGRHDEAEGKGCKSRRIWRLDKGYCNIAQVDDSLYRWSPFIISEKDNLESIPHLEETFISVSDVCSSANNEINSFLEANAPHG